MSTSSSSTWYKAPWEYMTLFNLEQLHHCDLDSGQSFYIPVEDFYIVGVRIKFKITLSLMQMF